MSRIEHAIAGAFTYACGLSRLLLTLLAPAVVPAPGRAQVRPPDLGDASIEDLMNIVITSASRKPQLAVDAASAVHVITQQDIRRSGLMTIPDVLRMVPGVDVAQINANKSAVSVRGFNGLYANKLLVLIDGRSIYNRIFSAIGQNLFETGHTESVATRSLLLVTQVRRNASVRLRWTFQ